MFHHEFDDVKVKQWIEDCAKEAADAAMEHDEPLLHIDECVDNACDGVAIYCDDALALVAYYGVFDCAFGRNESWEECPAAQFETDVSERAYEILEEHGYSYE